MSSRQYLSDEDDDGYLDGIIGNTQFDDYVDSDPVNIAFGVFIFLYIVALTIFYAGPLLLNPFQGDSVLQAMVYWSLFKSLVPLIGIILSIFNITDLPLTFILLAVTALCLLNSCGFGIIFVYDFITANSATYPNNIANDPLRCCVYYATPNSGCVLSDGPCPSNYPQTKSDLLINSSFVFYGSMILILIILEAVLLVLGFFIRRARIAKEIKFFSKMDEDTQEPNPKTNLGGLFHGKPIQTLNRVTSIIKSSLSELGKVQSFNGFKANKAAYIKKNQ